MPQPSVSWTLAQTAGPSRLIRNIFFKIFDISTPQITFIHLVSTFTMACVARFFGTKQNKAESSKKNNKTQASQYPSNTVYYPRIHLR